MQGATGGSKAAALLTRGITEHLEGEWGPRRLDILVSLCDVGRLACCVTLSLTFSSIAEPLHCSTLPAFDKSDYRGGPTDKDHDGPTLCRL